MKNCLEKVTLFHSNFHGWYARGQLSDTEMTTARQTDVNMHTCVCVCMRACMCVHACMHVCMHVCVCGCLCGWYLYAHAQVCFSCVLVLCFVTGYVLHLGETNTQKFTLS